MIRPPALKEGDSIGIISPSGKINPEFISKSVEVITKEGFRVVTGKNLLNTHFQYAGTDEERLYDFQQMLDNPDIRAILCSRGGYGAIRIAGKLDFSAFKENPKWVIGFSDITVIHALLNHRIGYMSIHGPMAKMIAEQPESQSVRYLFDLIRGKKLRYSFESFPLNQTGRIKGQLITGNLAVLTSLIGTDLDFDPKEKILFIEEIGEYPYRIDRMMHQLKLSGRFEGLKALIVGEFTGTDDHSSDFGKKVYEIILEHVSPFNFPVCFNFPAGHGNVNWSLISGADYELIIDETRVEFNEL